MRIKYRTTIIITLIFMLFLSAGCSTMPGSSDEILDTENSYRGKIDSARMLAQSGRYEKANSILNEVLLELETEAEDISPRIELMALFYRAGTFRDMNMPDKSLADFERATAAYEASEEKTPGFSRDLYMELGRARGLNGDHAAAREAFKAALEANESAAAADPGFSARVHAIISGTYRHTGEMNEAKAEIEKAISIVSGSGINKDNPGFAGSLYMELSDLRRMTSDFKNAAGSAAQAAAYFEADGSDPNRTATAYYFCAINLMQAGIHENQYESYEKAVSFFDSTTNPNFEYLGVASYNLGNFLQRIGNLTSAEYYFSRAEEAYGQVLRVIRSRELAAPGSIPADVSASFASRRADAVRRLRELEIQQKQPVVYNPGNSSETDLAEIMMGPDIYIFRITGAAVGIAGGTSETPRKLSIEPGNQVLELYSIDGPRSTGPFKLIARLSAGETYYLNPDPAGKDGFSLADKKNKSAVLDLGALGGNRAGVLSMYIKHVMNPTMDESGKSVLLENDNTALLFQPDMVYTLTDKISGNEERGRSGFIMDFSMSSGRLFLLESDTDKMSREQFLEESGYEENAGTVLIPTACDGTTVTYEYERPESRKGEEVTFTIQQPQN